MSKKARFAMRLWVRLGLTLSVLALGLSQSAWAKPGYPVFGYLPTYASTGPFGDVININDASKFPWDRLTHVMEAFAQPTSGGGLTFPNGQRANLVLVAHQNNTRVILSIGGAGTPLSYWNSATSGGTLTTFVNNILAIVDSNGYDGIDIDWEFPTSGQKPQFTALMNQLYTALHSRTISCSGCGLQGQEKQLVFFGSPGNDICGVDWNNVVGAAGSANTWNVDYCIVGGYDMNAGPGYNGPISDTSTYTDCRGVSNLQLSMTQTLQTLTSGGANFKFPISKMIMGLPMYTLQNSTGFSKGTPALVVLRNGVFQQFLSTPGESRYTLGGTNQYVTDAQGFCAKMDWAINTKGMPGIALWEITHMYPADDAKAKPVWDTIGGVAACFFKQTPTPGPTPSGGPPAGMVDIGSDTNSNNTMLGTWSYYAGTGGSSIALTYTQAGYSGSPYNGTGPQVAVEACGTAGSGIPSASTGLGPANPITDITSYNRLDFWFKGTPGVYRTGFDCTATRNAAPSPNDHYGYDFTVTDNAWHAYSFYFIDARQAGWGTAAALDLAHTIALFWEPKNAGSGSFCFDVDDIQLVTDLQTPTITPTPQAWLLDTVEDGNGIDNWGGQWNEYHPAGTGVMNTQAAGYPFSAYGNKFSVDYTGTNVGNINTLSVFFGAGATPSVNLGVYNTFKWYQRGNGSTTSYTIAYARASGENWTYTYTLPADTLWHYVEVPLVQSAWSYNWGGTANSWGINNGQRFYFYTADMGAFSFAVDDLEFENRPPSPTPTVTASFTRTATPTASPSPSNSATPSMTSSPSASPSSSPSVTPSMTPSATPSASPTLSRTTTASPTATITVTFTTVPVGSTETPTPTVSPTWTASRTASPSASPTSSPSVSPTVTLTQTPLASSPTVTMTQTASADSPTGTPSVSPSGTASQTLTASPSRTSTPSASPSFTTVPPGSTATATPTLSPVLPSATATPSVTPSLSWTPVAPGSTATATPTFTPTATPTLTTVGGAPAATASVSGNGTLQVLAGGAFPNPSPSSIRLRLDGPADTLIVDIYTVSMQRVERLELPGAYAGGWVSAPLPLELREKFAAGTYYFRADALRGQTRALKPWVGRFVFLR